IFSRDWSSDVCSSDLLIIAAIIAVLKVVDQKDQDLIDPTALTISNDEEELKTVRNGEEWQVVAGRCVKVKAGIFDRLRTIITDRSEERRVGKEGRGR